MTLIKTEDGNITVILNTEQETLTRGEWSKLIANPIRSAFDSDYTKQPEAREPA